MSDVDQLIQRYTEFAKKVKCTEFTSETSSDLLQEHVALIIDMQRILQGNAIDMIDLKKLQKVTTEVTEAFAEKPKKLKQTKEKKVSPNSKKSKV